MTLFRDISVIWAMLNIHIFFIILMEFRFPLKKTVLYSLGFFAGIAALDLWYLLSYGPARMAQNIFLIMLLPSVCFYFFLSRYRDARFLYSFFLICDLNADLTIVTYLIDRALPGPDYLWMLMTRLLLFPALNLLAYRFLRRPYLSIQHSVEKGWFGLSLTAALFYVLVIRLFSYPSMIEERPEYLLPLLLTVILTPLINWYIFSFLKNQQELHDAAKREQLLNLETLMIKRQLDQTAAAEKQLSIWQHDLRHHFRTLAVLLESEKIRDAKDYIASADTALLQVRGTRLCANNVLNAVFSFYFDMAREEGIQIEAELDAKEQVDIDERELSVVFANALENAIAAVKVLPEKKRFIRCRLISYPGLMFRVSNPFQGEVIFDKDSFPVVRDGTQKGIGTRSIEAYCKKHGAWCDFYIKDDLFVMQLTQP